MRPEAGRKTDKPRTEKPFLVMRLSTPTALAPILPNRIFTTISH